MRKLSPTEHVRSADVPCAGAPLLHPVDDVGRQVGPVDRIDPGRRAEHRHQAAPGHRQHLHHVGEVGRRIDDLRTDLRHRERLRECRLRSRQPGGAAIATQGVDVGEGAGVLQRRVQDRQVGEVVDLPRVGLLARHPQSRDNVLDVGCEIPGEARIGDAPESPLVHQAVQ